MPANRHRPAFGRDFGVGWVGFVYSPSMLSTAIAVLTMPDRRSGVTITHAFVVTGPDECVEANLPDGVVANKLGEGYLDRDDRLVIFRKPRGLTPEAGERIAARARSQVGARFDYGAFVTGGVTQNF